MSKLYPLFLFISLILVSCGQGYRINGSSDVAVIDGKMIYLKGDKEGKLTIIDSAEIIHGKFSMKGNADSAQLVSIFIDNESYMPMVLEKGDIEISITPTGFDIKGTPLNEQLYKYIHAKDELDAQIEEAVHAESQLIMNGIPAEEAHEQTRIKSTELTKQIKDLTSEFIRSNYHNVLGPSIFLMVCTSSFPYPVLTPDLQSLYENAPESFREDKELKQYIEKARENNAYLKELKRMQETQDVVRTNVPAIVDQLAD